jgi:2'-5' RNA ligase
VTDDLRTSAGQIYARISAEAIDYFRSGKVGIDPYLLDKANDRRLGLSVIGRPGSAVNQEFADFLDQVRQVASNQYYYQTSEFHLTILSLFTATEEFEPYWNNLTVYRSAVARALLEGQAFTVHYRGVTLSKNAVLIQGFAQGPQLDQLRASLRQSLRIAGLDGDLDQRYTLETAHSTGIRFASQPQDLSELLSLLQGNRKNDFGKTTFHELQLVKSDWYMSQDKVEVLAKYPLSSER